MEELFKIGVDWSKPTLAIETTWGVISVVVLVIGLIVQAQLGRRHGRKLGQGLAPPESVEVTLNLLGIAEVKGTWKPDDSERKAAWELYAELITRIAIVKLPADDGLLREALASLQSLFNITRQILRHYGPTVAKPKGDGSLSFGYLAVNVLNLVLRPVLTKWHPLLQHHETSRPAGTSPLDHERSWSQHDDLRNEIDRVRTVLTNYAEILAKVAGVPSLVVEQAND